MRFNATRHTINELNVTAKEYQIMSFFRENQGKALTKQEITLAVWGEQIGSNCLAVLVKAVRKKLPVNIETVYGIGYRYKGESYDKAKLQTS